MACRYASGAARGAFAMSFDVPAWVSPGPQLLLWPLTGSGSPARGGHGAAHRRQVDEATFIYVSSEG